MALASTAAQAQGSGCSVQECNEQLLANFGTLYTTPAGMAILQQSLATEVNIYLTSSYDRKQTAALDAELDGLVPYYNIWNHAVPALSGLFNQGSILTPGNYFPSQEGAYYQTVNAVAGTVGSIADDLKDYFGDPSRASYYHAYAVLPQYQPQDPTDPRPFVVSAQINDNPWTTSQTSALAVAIQQTSGLVPGQKPQDWANYVTSAAFPSGHSTFGNSVALLTGIMAPQYFKDFLMAGVEFGLSRNIFGVHHPLDVIGGRLIATYNVSQWLNGNFDQAGVSPGNLSAASADLQAYIGSGGSSPYAAACEGDVIGCIRGGAIPTAAEFAQDRALYTYLLTYGLPALSSTTELPVVPLGAEALISTRFPYLSAEQRREVLATTELPSGNALDNGVGWARLNLFAAADGFGALNCGGEGATHCTQIVTMNAGLGGYNAFDVWANDMTGNGGLRLQGDGTLVLAGNSSYSGGTSVIGGMLAVTGSIAGPVTVYDQGALYNAGRLFAQGGSVVRNNGGALFNDGTIESDVINGGVFGNDGTVAGSVTTTGLLFGTGHVNGNLAVLGGTIAPGNSIGTFNVGGDVVLGTQATYQVEIEQDGSSDRIVAGGEALIEGARMQVAFGDGTVLGLRSFQVISADGVTGTFGSINDPFGTAYPFLDVGLTYTEDGVVLHTQRSDVPFALFARTANQIAAAAALDTAQLTNGAFDDAVLSLNAGTAPAAFAALSPEIGASAKGVFIADSRFLRGAIFDRLRSADAPGQSSDIAVAPLAYAAPAAPANAAFPVKAEAVAPAPSATLWARGFGAWTSTDGNANAAGLDSNVGGAFIGADTRLDAWRLGVLGGYSSTNFDVDARNSSGSSDNWHAGLYAGRDWGPLALRTGLTYSWQAIDTTRSVAFNGYADQLKADYDAATFQAFGELGYGVETAFARFEPFANLAYVSLHTDGHGEQGGGAALVAPGSTMDTSFTTLGLRAVLPLVLGTTSAALSGTIGWQHAFGDITPTETSTFAIGSAPFTVSGLPIAEDAALVEAGLHVALSPAADLSVAYAGQFGDGTTQNGVNATLKLSF